jgi:serine/threonine protein kinase
MGAVYLARDSRFQGRPVALKETLVDRTRHDLRRQFEREALLLFDLKHQALPKVSDYFSEGDGEFLVMEFVDGLDLSELLTRNDGPFGIRQVLAWVGQLLDALAYLHSQDPPIIHRDIKPNNVKLTPKGQVVLLDFGLAKESLHAATQGLSRSVIAGTPFYAPLEQMNGQGTDERSDLYSLAATAYTLLSTRPPADAGKRATELINGRADPLVPLTALVPGFPEPLWKALERALSLPREGRPRSAVEMREELTVAWSRSTAPETSAPAGGTLTMSSATASARSSPTVTPTVAATAPAARPTVPTGPPSGAIGEAPTTEPFVDETSVVEPPRPTAWRFLVAAAAIVLIALGTTAAFFVVAWPGAAETPPSAPPPPAPSAEASPKAEPKVEAPRPVYAEALRWRLERADGAVLSASASPIATGEEFRFRFSSPVAGSLFLLAPDEAGTYRAYLTNRASTATNMKSNAIGPGRDVVFPGAPLTLSVREGETRFLVVVAPATGLVPAALGGEPLSAVSPDEVAALEAAARDEAGAIVSEVAEDGSSTVVRRIEGRQGVLVFEIRIVGKTGGRD